MQIVGFEARYPGASRTLGNREFASNHVSQKEQQSRQGLPARLKAHVANLLNVFVALLFLLYLQDICPSLRQRHTIHNERTRGLSWSVKAPAPRQTGYGYAPWMLCRWPPVHISLWTSSCGANLGSDNVTMSNGHSLKRVRFGGGTFQG
jgi:hypothetical protein